jgi:hypothetical protein
LLLLLLLFWWWWFGLGMGESNFAFHPDKVLYDDGYITLDSLGITIRGYYFPLCLSTAILYRDIVQFGSTDQLDISCCSLSIWGTHNQAQSQQTRIIVITLPHSIAQCQCVDVIPFASACNVAWS